MEISAPVQPKPNINANDPQIALVKFVEALAVRQARIDAGIYFQAANDNKPRKMIH